MRVPLQTSPAGQRDAVRAVVIDTNIVLDMFVFQDEKAATLLHVLARGDLCWLATEAMRVELARVLGYPQIAPRLGHEPHAAQAVLARFDAAARRVPAPVKAGVTCKDVDDQKFIDLAVQHKAVLLSKDRAVLCMAKRLLASQVSVLTAIDFEA